MSVQSEWYALQNQLQHNNLDCKNFSNQFFYRLLIVLNDNKALTLDKLLAYKDALNAAPKDTVGTLELPIVGNLEVTDHLLKKCNLLINFQNRIQLIHSLYFTEIDMSSIYQLETRRFINKLRIDPALKKKLKNDRYQSYNGATQQLAVRLALTTENNSTLLINLPTGCGKTLVAHALSLFSPNNKMILVIVPTTALAIDQGKRVGELLDNINQGHGGVYCWYGEQTKSQHDDIKQRIRSQQQRILFCSPEAACKSLLPVLFSSCESNAITSIVIDEAHVIDNWGVSFRPYFQYLSSLVRALRNVSPDGIKCILMSATFTEKTVADLKNLFYFNQSKFIEIHGSFLRPEIQYHVVKTVKEEHTDQVVNAVIHLPKPLIVYSLKPKDAKLIYSLLIEEGLKRIGLYTGEEVSEKKDTLIEKWNNDQLDVMIANAAFGVGMDKPNIRSVIHMAVPVNLESFYQEVGRAGRDGNACQSLLIYYDDQVDDARKKNNQRLIGEDKGFKKWDRMWDSGSVVDGNKRLAIESFHDELSRKSTRNEDWNRRTLLLMQRTGVIELTLEKPSPPEYYSDTSEEIYRSQIEDYYRDYYNNIIVTLSENHNLKDKKIWDEIVGGRRTYEKKHREEDFKKLTDWIANYKNEPLCHILEKHYTIHNIQPEYACGGCPSCRENNKEIYKPTLGYSSLVLGVPYAEERKGPLHNMGLHKYIYYPNTMLTNRILLRGWMNWLTKLIELKVVQCICADNDVLETFNDLIPPGVQNFWIGMPLEEINNSTSSYWSQLILGTSSMVELPDLGWEQSIKILIAPENIKDKVHYNCLWWERKSTAVSLNTFLLGLKNGNYK